MSYSSLQHNRIRGRRYAAQMRHHPTSTEAMLAEAMKKRRWAFKTQSQMFDATHLYIVDFLVDIHDGKLVIEIDGPCHHGKEHDDATRTDWIRSQRKYLVLRLTAKEVL